MRPDTQIKEEELRTEAEDEAPAEVRGLEMRVEDGAQLVEELQRQLMSAELAAQQEREQQDQGREVKEQISEVTGSFGS